MKTLTHIILSGLLGLSAFVSAAAHAQVAPMAPSSKPTPAEYTEAEVRKIDKENNKITLKHAEIKNLGMPPMAMVFEVTDGAALNKLKNGDKVRFKAIYDAGKYIVVDIQPAK
jgi:Cu(I)/Ag(I) efflux system periplasmic protein CusF